MSGNPFKFQYFHMQYFSTLVPRACQGFSFRDKLTESACAADTLLEALKISKVNILYLIILDMKGAHLIWFGQNSKLVELFLPEKNYTSYTIYGYFYYNV